MVDLKGTKPLTQSSPATQSGMAASKKKRWSGKMLNSMKNAKEITKRNAAGSLLLSLSPEIRNRIWKLVLGGQRIHVFGIGDWVRGRKLHQTRVHLCEAEVDDYELAMNVWTSEKSFRMPSCEIRRALCPRRCSAAATETRSLLAILETCRQVHSEAALLPFTSNIFIFSLWSDAITSSRRLMPLQRRNVRVIMARSSHPPELKFDGVFSGLKELLFVVRDGWVFFQGGLEHSFSRERSWEFLGCSAITRAVCSLIEVETSANTLADHDQACLDPNSEWKSNPAVYNVLSDKMEGRFLAAGAAAKAAAVAKTESKRQAEEERERQGKGTSKGTGKRFKKKMDSGKPSA